MATRRRLPIPWLLGCTLAMLTTATPAAANLDAAARIEAARARGEIGDLDAARQTLFFLFDRSRLERRWAGAEEPPPRCGTATLAALIRRSARDPRIQELVDAALEPTLAAPPAVHRTPHFEISYQTSGPDAPPQIDVDPANGVPDWVERTGEACERSWTIEVDQLGYTAPALQGGAGGRYPVTYQAQEAYGYTTVVSGERTRIVLHPNYEGFPPNEDPDGDALGSLRVTVAHELKHAIQRMYTLWFEDQWLELDATWIEDVVYDEVDDYVNFVRRALSPFTNPGVSLDLGGGGSYEDCHWQHYLSERFGLDHMLAFWNRRRAISAEPVMSTYMATIAAEGIPFARAWGEYASWVAASGFRSAASFGFGEASLLPTAPPATTHPTLPVVDAPASVHHLAAGIHLVPNPAATLAGEPRFAFQSLASPAASWGVSVVFRDRAGQVSGWPMTLIGGAGTLALTGVDWAELEWAALVVGHATEGGPALPYRYSIDAVGPLRITHLPVTVAASQTAVPVGAQVTSGTAALDPSSITLVWRVGDGQETRVSMPPSPSPPEFAAEIPRQPDGALVEYRIEARTASGQALASPALPGTWHPYQSVTAFDAFESEGSWTSGDPGDDATTGAWVRAQPIGTAAAPHEDASPPPGAWCFVTGHGLPNGAGGAEDVDDGRTTLTSPVFAFPLGHAWQQAVVRYRRWYSNHVGGRADDTLKVDLSNDGGATWTRAETVIEGAEGWTPVTLDLLGTFGAPDRLRVRFVAEDRGNPSLVEAGLDDFELLAILSDPVSVEGRAASRDWLGAPSPNPSRAGAAVRVRVATDGPADACVLDLQGRRVRRLAVPNTASGTVRELTWDGRRDDGSESPAGLYVMEVRSGERRGSRLVVRLR